MLASVRVLVSYTPKLCLLPSAGLVGRNALPMLIATFPLLLRLLLPLLLFAPAAAHSALIPLIALPRPTLLLPTLTLPTPLAHPALSLFPKPPPPQTPQQLATSPSLPPRLALPLLLLFLAPSWPSLLLFSKFSF